MKWVILLVGVIVLCFTVALVLGLVGRRAGGMGDPESTLSHERLPDGELHDEDLDELQFDVALRGYRMSQVDGVVDRLRRALREKDEQVAVLLADLERRPPLPVVVPETEQALVEPEPALVEPEEPQEPVEPVGTVVEPEEPRESVETEASVEGPEGPQGSEAKEPDVEDAGAR